MCHSVEWKKRTMWLFFDLSTWKFCKYDHLLFKMLNWSVWMNWIETEQECKHVDFWNRINKQTVSCSVKQTPSTRKLSPDLMTSFKNFLFVCDCLHQLNLHPPKDIDHVQLWLFLFHSSISIKTIIDEWPFKRENVTCEQVCWNVQQSNVFERGKSDWHETHLFPFFPFHIGLISWSPNVLIKKMTSIKLTSSISIIASDFCDSIYFQHELMKVTENQPRRVKTKIKKKTDRKRIEQSWNRFHEKILSIPKQIEQCDNISETNKLKAKRISERISKSKW